jgi:hypothetical protein
VIQRYFRIKIQEFYVSEAFFLNLEQKVLLARFSMEKKKQSGLQ